MDYYIIHLELDPCVLSYNCDFLLNCYLIRPRIGIYARISKF